MIQVFALIVFALGTVGLFLPVRWSLIFLMVLSVFGAAGTVILPGNASVQPANLYLLFLGLRLILLPGGFTTALLALRPGSRGFWVGLLTAIGLVSSVFYPRIFEGQTLVWAIDRATEVTRPILIPLRPTSGNITQTIYLMGGLATFMMAYAFTQKGSGMKGFATGLYAVAITNLVMALLDLVTAAAGVGYLLSFVRSAGYAMMTEDAIGGTKRIAGSFPEASAFAAYSAPLFLALTVLWWHGYRPRLSGCLAILTFLALVLSTSTTAYAALALYALVGGSLIGLKVLSGRISTKAVVLLFMMGIGVSAIGLMAATNRLPASALTIVNSTIVGKADSDSGRERSEWNRQALQNVVDTYGVGAGLGSGRVSSFIVCLLAGLGIPGALCFAAFVSSLMVGRPPPAHPGEKALRAAASAIVLGTIGAAAISAGVFDLGTLFYATSGVLAATIERRRAPVAGLAQRRAPMRIEGADAHALG